MMTDSQVTRTERLERALEAAVLQCWKELMPVRSSGSGLIHVEYQTSSNGALQFLRVWSSTVRGYWNLVCEMWMQALWSNLVGVSFANDYRCVAFAPALRLATQDMGPG